jgi:hypothetical protein
LKLKTYFSKNENGFLNNNCNNIPLNNNFNHFTNENNCNLPTVKSYSNINNNALIKPISIIDVSQINNNNLYDNNKFIQNDNISPLKKFGANFSNNNCRSISNIKPNKEMSLIDEKMQSQRNQFFQPPIKRNNKKGKKLNNKNKKYIPSNNQNYIKSQKYAEEDQIDDDEMCTNSNKRKIMNDSNVVMNDATQFQLANPSKMYNNVGNVKSPDKLENLFTSEDVIQCEFILLERLDHPFTPAFKFHFLGMNEIHLMYAHESLSLNYLNKIYKGLIRCSSTLPFSGKPVKLYYLLKICNF